MIKDYNEITVQVTETLAQAAGRLAEQGCAPVRRQKLLDRYYLPEQYDPAQPTPEILNQAILIREIRDVNGENPSLRVKLSRKYKECSPDGEILRQSNTDVEIGGEEQVRNAAAFLEAIGYRWAFDVEDDLTVYEKDGLGMVLQQVSGDRFLFLEAEENDRYQGIPLLIRKLDETGIVYDHSDYFCKKAQIIYDEMYR